MSTKASVQPPLPDYSMPDLIRFPFDKLHEMPKPMPAHEPGSVTGNPALPATGWASILRGLRELCDEHGVLIIFDEVQCGMGRTGKLWAHEWAGMSPDIMAVAKALGGGLPIGVMAVKKEISDTLGPGTHASTFGGGPVICRASLAVLQAIQ